MKRANGFTLIELMVSFLLFSMMILLVGDILQRGEAQTNLTDNKMVMQQALREALYRMSQEIRESAPSRISVTNNGALLTFQIPASVNNSGVITWSSPITYQVGGNGRQLVRTDTGSGQSRILANDVQTVVFTVSGSPVATVNYTVTAQRTLTNGRILSLGSTGGARLRNP